jgi:hypothetical protein
LDWTATSDGCFWSFGNRGLKAREPEGIESKSLIQVRFSISLLSECQTRFLCGSTDISMCVIISLPLNYFHESQLRCIYLQYTHVLPLALCLQSRQSTYSGYGISPRSARIWGRQDDVGFWMVSRRSAGHSLSAPRRGIGICRTSWSGQERAFATAPSQVGHRVINRRSGSSVGYPSVSAPSNARS